MCGIFGIVITNNVKYKNFNISKVLNKLSLFSESRGKDSSGICFRNESEQKYSVIKATDPISSLLKEDRFLSFLKDNLSSFKNARSSYFTSFGHSRLVTNGSQLQEVNNQPVIKDGIIAIHNGIIVNVDDLWKSNPQIKRDFEIDTEVFLALIRHFVKQGLPITDAIRKTFGEISGTVSSAMFFDDRDDAVLVTNNGSLYYATNYIDFLVFASEGFILKKLLSCINIEDFTGKLVVNNLRSNTGLLINLTKFSINNFSIESGAQEDKLPPVEIKKYDIDCIPIDGKNSDKPIIIDINKFHLNSNDSVERKLLEYNLERIKNLKRCSKCLLPETFPFIKFDENGECNYCKHYVRKNQPKRISALIDLVEPYKKTNGLQDCVVPFSGGRDSTYVLHFVKKELGLNPIAFTYDWGMVTDLARRNIARVCGKLGVENIIVAADIKVKRRNIKLNIESWLKNPQLGMIPIFMAGDKQFFKYANQIKRQSNIKLNIWGINFLENTDFKVGFCGVAPDWNKEMIYSMSAKRKINLFCFVGKNYLETPSYINRSIFDTFESFLSRYSNPRKDYYHFFDFHEWNENEIEKTIINEYGWETAKDLKSTWRIGDGTASFYNYIYYTVAGFSEFDTFRSNQIREGMITRDVGLELINGENMPRYESLRWYLEIIGLDFATVIKTINKIPKLYEV